MRRGITATVLAASLALVATACGGGDDGQSSGKSSGELSGTVTWWDTSTVGSEDIVFKKIAEGFEKEHPKVDVKYVNVPFGEAQNKFKNAAQANSGAPDVIRSEVAWTPDFADLGYLAPLDGTPALKDKGDFLKQAAASTVYKGKTYAVPQVIDSMGIFYNKKIFKEAGVEVPSNITELKAAARTIKDKTGKTGMYLRGDDAYWFLSFLYGEGGDLVDASSKTVTVDKPEGVKAFKVVKDLVDSGAAKTDATDGWENMQSAFKDGKVAMMINGPWAVADTLTGKEFTDKSNLGIAPVPAVGRAGRAAGRPQPGGLRGLQEPGRLLCVRPVHDLRGHPGPHRGRAEPAADAHLRVRPEGGRQQRDRRLLQAGRRDRGRAALDPGDRWPVRPAGHRVHQGPHRPDHAGKGGEVDR